jgi:hypothetical protein
MHTLIGVEVGRALAALPYPAVEGAWMVKELTTPSADAGRTRGQHR